MPRPKHFSSKSEPTHTAVIKAVEGLTDGVYGMFSKRLELAKVELITDGQRLGMMFLILFVCGIVIVLGYGMLNVAVVMLVAAASGLWPSAWTALGLAIANLVFGALIAVAAAKRLGVDRSMLATRDEFQRDVTWLKEVKERSKLEEAEVTQP